MSTLDNNILQGNVIVLEISIPKHIEHGLRSFTICDDSQYWILRQKKHKDTLRKL